MAIDPAYAGAPAASAPRTGILAQSRIALLFLVSGVAALIYQICWQRLLFQTLGVDMESVTIIVSTFMLGLGVGALIGGEMVDRHPSRTVEMFALMELGTAMFGVLSPFLLRGVGALFIDASRVAVCAANFGLLLIPTTLMGATLPILVANFVRRDHNIGASVGMLYFANTLGAALGAGLTGFLLLYYVGLTSAIEIAAALNVFVSACVWYRLRVARV